MDQIRDLLGRYKAQEPEEISAIKAYVTEQFHMPASVSVRADSLIITVPSASLANTLRLRTTEIKQIANTDKRLVFRISQ